MVIRVHDGTETEEWLIPAAADTVSEGGFVLAVRTRVPGPIELLSPSDCRVVATAVPARTGNAVLVQYWDYYDGDATRWGLTASVDTILEDPTPPVPSSAVCA
jgi:hypothetical protein